MSVFWVNLKNGLQTLNCNFQAFLFIWSESFHLTLLSQEMDESINQALHRRHFQMDEFLLSRGQPSASRQRRAGREERGGGRREAPGAVAPRGGGGGSGCARRRRGPGGCARARLEGGGGDSRATPALPPSPPPSPPPRRAAPPPLAPSSPPTFSPSPCWPCVRLAGPLGLGFC